MKWQFYATLGATVLVGISLVALVILTDPDTASAGVKVLFFVLIGSLVWGLASLLFYRRI